jgi:hypothetical protein
MAMSDKSSIFFDEWRACLRAHYKYVVQVNDTVTEPTLRAVLLQSGLTDDELRALIDEAHAETLPESGDTPPDTDSDPVDGQMAMF